MKNYLVIVFYLMCYHAKNWWHNGFGMRNLQDLSIQRNSSAFSLPFLVAIFPLNIPTLLSPVGKTLIPCSAKSILFLYQLLNVFCLTKNQRL
jgi:hypothetical protein